MTGARDVARLWTRVAWSAGRWRSLAPAFGLLGVGLMLWLGLWTLRRAVPIGVVGDDPALVAAVVGEIGPTAFAGEPGAFGARVDLGQVATTGQITVSGWVPGPAEVLIVRQSVSRALAGEASQDAEETFATEVARQRRSFVAMATFVWWLAWLGPFLSRSPSEGVVWASLGSARSAWLGVATAHAARAAVTASAILGIAWGSLAVASSWAGAEVVPVSLGGALRSTGALVLVVVVHALAMAALPAFGQAGVLARISVLQPGLWWALVLLTVDRTVGSAVGAWLGWVPLYGLPRVIDGLLGADWVGFVAPYVAAQVLPWLGMFAWMAGRVQRHHVVGMDTRW